MSRKSEVTITWTCDVCGATEPEVDGYSPSGWQQIAVALVTAQLGNVSAKHLCVDCGESLTLLLADRLGDTGDLAQAWDEGYRAGWDDRHSDEHAPLLAGEQHDTPNPYRAEAAR